MASLLPPLYQALLGVGFLAVLGLCLLALTWHLVEPRLLHWLERRRAHREAGRPAWPRRALRRNP